jgi:hypothetical protein
VVWIVLALFLGLPAAADAQAWLYQSGPGGGPPLQYSAPQPYWQQGVSPGWHGWSSDQSDRDWQDWGRSSPFTGDGDDLPIAQPGLNDDDDGGE